MEKLAFCDGEKLGVFDGENTSFFESNYIRRYREYAETRTKNDEWKFGGEGARFRGDYDRARLKQEKIYASVNAVQWDGEKLIYAATVNGSSAIYRKDLSDEKAAEEHIISSSDESFCSLHRVGNLLAVTIEHGDATSSIGTLDCATAELKTLTDGDSRDANAVFSSGADAILFDTMGVGRTSDGEFTGKYTPAAVCSLDLNTLEIKEILQDGKYSYVHPKQAKDGALYCIRRPAKAKRRGNVFLDILLIPFRILQAIVMFIQYFVIAMTGKSLTSEGDNPAKGREQNSRKLFVDGNFIEAEKEMKRNRKQKDADYGFNPRSWELIRIFQGKTETIKSGVCDFALCRDGGVYCTNGRRIFYVSEGVSKKIAETEKCLCVATAENSDRKTYDLFGL